MSIRQNVHNESDNYSSAIITAKYSVEFKDDYVWTHRDVDYNDAGIPILKLYEGETKRVFKEIYLNGKLNNSLLINKTLRKPLDNDDGQICEIVSNPDENWITIRAITPGTFIVQPDISGTVDLNLYTDVRDTDLIVIIEEKPKILKLAWTRPNPLIINAQDDMTISINVLYDNGQEFEIPPDKLEQLQLISSNPHAANAGEWYRIIDGEHIFGYTTVSVKKYEEKQNKRCRIKITDESFKKVFGEDIENLEPLEVVISNSVDWKLLLDAKINIEYEKQFPMLVLNTISDVTSTFTPSIFITYTLSDGRVLRYDANDIYYLKTTDKHIVDIDERANTISPVALGTATIQSVCSYIDASWYENEESFAEIPKSLISDITVIKELIKIEWTVDNINLNADEDEGTLQVTGYYTNDTSEDMLSLCSFSYDSNIIKIEGNKIIPLSPGTTELALLGFENFIGGNKTYTITVVQRLKNIDIVDDENTILNEKDLILHVDEQKQLKYILNPENATHDEIIWTSSNTGIVSVDESGKVTAVNKGLVTVYASVKPEEKEPVEPLPKEEITEQASPKEIETESELSIYARCNIEVREIEVVNIEVTDIDITDEEMILYVGDDATDIDVTVLPENATNKKLKLIFESDYRYNPVGLNDTDLTIQGEREGSGILKIISVSNSNVVAEIKVTVIDNRIKKITINDGNDKDYEYYDDFVKSPEVELYEDDKTADDKIENNERWDDDDFPRYYCPINNSLQISASIEPANADYADLIWYSSDGTLVKCTETGIITPIRIGNQELDMENDDSDNDKGRRFPNTTWITAFNKKSMKSAVCQVRVTRNNITGFLIDSYLKNNYDVDIFDENGTIKTDLPRPLEYEQDYILWRGEKKILPVTILVQDPNFGPSNGFNWVGLVTTRKSDGFMPHMRWNDIISLAGDSINRDNITNEFDWTGINPSQFNNDNKNLNVEISADGLGSVSFYAHCEDEYWRPKIITKECDIESGQTDRDGSITLLDGCTLSLTYNVWFREMIINAGMIPSGVPAINAEIIASEVPIVNAEIKMLKTLDNKYAIYINIPPIMYNADNIQNEIFLENGLFCKYRYHAYIRVAKNFQPLNNADVYITHRIENNKTRNIKGITNSDGYIRLPRDYISTVTTSDINSVFTNTSYSLNSGEWVTVENSRKVNITVVDSPKKIYICFQDNSLLLTKGLPDKDLSSVWPESIRVKIKKYKTKYSVPLFIKFDDDFIESLQEFSGTNNECPLDDKYMSFAWFTSDPDVFIPIEPTQAPVKTDIITINEESSYNETLAKWKPIYNLKGYGRYMHILPTGTGKAKLTIVNIMSGQAWERLIEVVE